MAHDVDRDPELLHPLARRTATVLEGLVPLPEIDAPARAVLSAAPGGVALLAELDALHVSVGRAARGVGELAAGLAAAAVAAEHADAVAADALTGPEHR